MLRSDDTPMKIIRTFSYNLIILLNFFYLGACSSLVPVAQTNTIQITDAKDSVKSWWTVSFKVRRPANTAPPFHTDVLIALQIQPVLRQFENHIDLWRFHRRSAYDSAGHRFSLMFYSRSAIADSLVEGLKNSRILKELQSIEEIERIVWPNMGDVRPEIAATSDKIWPKAIQETWPYFIRGVSDAWLRLVDHHSRALLRQADSDISAEPVEQQLEFYRQVHQKVSQQWRQAGLHAYMHHLSSVFAYEQTLIRF